MNLVSSIREVLRARFKALRVFLSGKLVSCDHSACRLEPDANRGGVRSGPSISRQIKIWSAAEKEAEKHRRKDMKKKKQNQGGGSGAGAGTGGGLDWLQSVGFEDEYLQQAREIENLLRFITPLISDCCCPFLYRYA